MFSFVLLQEETVVPACCNILSCVASDLSIANVVCFFATPVGLTVIALLCRASNDHLVYHALHRLVNS